MIEIIASELGGVDEAVVWGLLALVAVQLALQAIALVDLARRPAVTLGRKWVWVLIIVFLGNSFVGPILYFALGHQSGPSEGRPEDETTVVEPGQRPSELRDAVEELYGRSHTNGSASGAR